MNTFKIFSEKANYFSFLVFIFSLTAPDGILIITFDLWLLFFVLDFSLNKRWSEIFNHKKKTIFIFQLLFILLITATFFYSENKAYAGKLIERRLAVFIIPFIGLSGVNKYFNFNQTLKILIIGTITGCFLISFKGLYDFFITYHLKAKYVTGFFDYFQAEMNEIKHRTYWGLFGLYSLASIYFLIKTNLIRNKEKIIYYLGGLLITIFIILSQARAVVFCLLFIIGVIITNEIRGKNKNLKTKIFLPLIFIVIISLLFTILPRFSIFFEKFSFNLEEYRQDEHRFLIWKYSWDILKNNWLTGVGLGDVPQKLNEVYLKNDFKPGIEFGFNLHNQYLQIVLEGGILLLFFLVLIFIFQFRIYKERKNLTTIFTFIIIFNFFFESVLNRFSGVIAFSIIPFILSLNSNGTKIFEMNRLLEKVYLKILTAVIVFTFITIVFGFIFKPDYNPQDPTTFADEPYELVNVSGLQNIPNGTKGVKFDEKFLNKNLNKSGSKILVINSIEITTDETIKADIFYNNIKKITNGNISLLIGSNEQGFQISDLNKNLLNSWQKVSVTKKFNPGEVYLLLQFKKQSLSDSIYGETIFAYPEFTR